jgi:hypothetical protein
MSATALSRPSLRLGGTTPVLSARLGGGLFRYPLIFL